MENAKSVAAPAARKEWGVNRKHHACQLRVTRDDGSSSLVLRGGSSMSSAIRRLQGQEGVGSVELVRKLTREEYRQMRLEDPAYVPPSSTPRHQLYPACEVRVTHDGVTSTRVVRRYWCQGTARMMLRQKSVDSVELIRRLTLEEYQAIGPDRKRVRRKPATQAMPPVPSEATAPTTPPEVATRRPCAWEVLICKEGGETSTMVVHALTERDAQGLACRLDGVTAAVAIGPLAEDEARARWSVS